MCRRLKIQLTETLSDTQYGFRERRSTEQAILRVRTVIRKALDQKKEVVLVFVDLQKAFDWLPTNTIVNRLIELNCSWNLVHSIRSLLDSPIGTLRDPRTHLL